MKKGLFITVEGGDGSGKSTQLANMKEYMASRGIEAVFTREPGGTGIGEQIREIILSTGNLAMCDMTEVLLYAAARAQLVREVIRPQLAAGKTIVCDRYLDSSLAYQGWGRGLGRETVEAINRFAVEDVIPDLTVFLDIAPQEARSRMAKRGEGPDRLESAGNAFHDRVYEGYLAILRAEEERGRSRIVRLDATRDAETVKQDLFAVLDRRFASWA